jgi:D-inositol-3-phosphate glycosyltransferase
MNVSLLAIAAAIAATGVEVDLLTRARERGGSRRLGPGVTLRSIVAGPAGVLDKDDLSEVADQFGEEIARLAGTAETGYDIIHAHYWLSGIAALPVALELSIPFVQTFHTLATMKDASRAPGTAPEPQRRRLSERFLAGQADAIIAVSAAEATHVVETMGAPAARVWVVPPGVDLALFSPLRSDRETAVREKCGVPVGQRIMVIVGRIQPLKGHELAIRALAALPEPRPALLVAGEPTPGAESFRVGLDTLAAELGVSKNVLFLGAIDREGIADLLAAADLTLIPSYSETFGLVALESAASGTPVVASYSTGLKESVSDGESGILIDSRDAADWAARIGALLSDFSALAILGQSARHFAERSGWNSTAVGLLSIYSSLERR